jgi:hypothetical protein
MLTERRTVPLAETPLGSTLFPSVTSSAIDLKVTPGVSGGYTKLDIARALHLEIQQEERIRKYQAEENRRKIVEEAYRRGFTNAMSYLRHLCMKPSFSRAGTNYCVDGPQMTSLLREVHLAQGSLLPGDSQGTFEFFQGSECEVKLGHRIRCGFGGREKKSDADEECWCFKVLPQMEERSERSPQWIKY